MSKLQNVCLFCTIFFMVETNIEVSGTVYDRYETSSQSTRIEENQEESPTFMCSSPPKSLNSSQICDGKSDCDDGSDEQDCEKGVVLYYYIYARGINYFQAEYSNGVSLNKLSELCLMFQQASLTGSYHRLNCGWRGEEFLDLVSLDLATNKDYFVNVLTNSTQMRYSYADTPDMKNFTLTKNISMTTEGLLADIYFTKNSTSGGTDESYTIQGGRDGFPNLAARRENRDSFRNPVMDWSTSHVFAIVNSEIKFCDKNITTCFSFIKSKFATDPLTFTIAIKQRLLFWIKKISGTQSYLLKYDLSKKNGSAIILKKDLKSPSGLTVDAARNQILWLEQGDGDLAIHSTSFNGSETKITNAVTGSLVKESTSIAVFNNTVYWADKSNMKMWKCSLNNNCTQMSLLRQISKKHKIMLLDSLNSDVGPLAIDYSQTLANATSFKKVCEAATCSHLCYPYSETAFDCYCSDNLLEANRTLCDSETLIVTYQNLVFIVGLLDIKAPPIIRRYTLSINISAVAYDSIQERVILTEVGRQNIYSWTPSSNELKIILRGGPGTISSIEFDDLSNNVYWIDPTNFTLKLMSMNNHLKTNVVAGNSTYVPSDFTLLTSQRVIVLLFVKNNSSTVLEHCSMDGALNSREAMFEDIEANDVGHLSIHFNQDKIRKNRQLYLLDKQTNELKFFTNGGPTTVPVQMSTGGTLNKIQTVTFVGDTLVWTSEDDRVIRRAKINVDFAMGSRYSYEDLMPTRKALLMHNATQSIDLKINEIGPGFLSLASVTNPYTLVDPSLSDYSKRSLMKCVHNNGGCEEICVKVIYNERFDATISCLCTEGKVLVNQTSCRAESELKTTTRQQPRTETSTAGTTIVGTVNRTKSVKSRNRRSGGASTNFMFPIIVGILVGFAVGYFREDLLLKFNSLRSRLSDNYPRVQLSRIRRSNGSTTSLCSKE